MLNVYVVAIMVMIIALYGFLSPKESAVRMGEADIIAQQMIYYHSAAGKTCKSECTGVIDPEAALATSKQGQGPFANGTFASFANSEYVVTYYRNATIADKPEFADEYEARVTAALGRKSEDDTGVWIGPYNRSTGRLDSIYRRAWRDPLTGVVSQPADSEIILANPSIPDGAPVIVNRK